MPDREDSYERPEPPAPDDQLLRDKEYRLRRLSGAGNVHGRFDNDTRIDRDDLALMNETLRRFGNELLRIYRVEGAGPFEDVAVLEWLDAAEEVRQRRAIERAAEEAGIAARDAYLRQHGVGA